MTGAEGRVRLTLLARRKLRAGLALLSLWPAAGACVSAHRAAARRHYHCRWIVSAALAEAVLDRVFLHVSAEESACQEPRDTCGRAGGAVQGQARSALLCSM